MPIGPDDKPSYQPWNEDHFSGDLLVSSMTPVQRWMYRTLLQKAFFHSTRPDLPYDHELLWRLAGCESRAQWDTNCGAVLGMFKVEDLGTHKLLSHKRLRKDWDNLQDKREVYSDRAKKGAAAKWGTETKSEIPASELPQKHLNPLKLLPSLCRTLLGVRAEREEYYKKDLKELTTTYGGNPVIEAFETWAKSYSGDTRYPVKEFIRVADQYLDGSLRVTINPKLEAVSIALYNRGQQAFTGKFQHTLNMLLSEYTAEEVEKAYSEFIDGKDDYGMRRAVKDFCEGGAKTIILASRKRKEDAERQTTYMDIESKRMAEAAENDRKNAKEEVVEESL